NDYEVIKGILRWMIEILGQKSSDLKPVEITLYKNINEESSLDKFAQIETVEEFESFFNLKLKAKELEKDDVLRIIREKISFYKSEIDTPFRYAHITFYKMEEQEHIAIQPMETMISGIAIDGL